MNEVKLQPINPVAIATATVQQTVVQMQSDFAQTGTYRPQDLRLVLGDITASVTVVPGNSFGAQPARK